MNTHPGVAQQVTQAYGRDRNLPKGIYRRPGQLWLWGRFQVDGVESRLSLRTTDTAEAEVRLNGARHRAEMKRFGSVTADATQRVYFIHDPEAQAIKIGVAVNVKTRYNNLKTGSVAPLVLLGSMPGSPELEKLLHRFLCKYHIRREWFEAPEMVLEFVRAMVRL